MTVVERGARALMKQVYGFDHWNECKELVREMYRRQAQAVLSAAYPKRDEGERDTVIYESDLEEARRDPKVCKFLAEADKYVDEEDKGQ